VLWLYDHAADDSLVQPALSDQRIPSHAAHGAQHGAKSGKLESVRPLLRFVATSLENNPGRQKPFGEIKKMQGDYYARVTPTIIGPTASEGSCRPTILTTIPTNT
jgi:hypothetical protein